MTPSLDSYRHALASVPRLQRIGRVSELTGLIVAVRGLGAEQGELCLVDVPSGDPVMAEVVGFRGHDTLIMPLGDLHGIGPSTPVHPTGHPFRLRVGPHLLGQVLDGLGRPMDGSAPRAVGVWQDTKAPPPSPLQRTRISQRLPLGVRALDTLIPCGQGQRLGIFAGSGVGKSSLLGMIARNAHASVNVICLVGERGREVKEFIERDLGADGLERSIVVCATSDQPALVRIKAAMVATSIAEYFREHGQHVLLLMDSVTRLAMAQREVGLAAGEPPATRGYPPSVWALLPQVLERAGAGARGSITGLYTVLVEGDDMNEPVADAVRAILDGHIVLDRALAHKNHYPAVDVLGSVSRLQGELLPRELADAAGALRAVMAAYRDKEDMIQLGVYEQGSDPLIDYAIYKKDDIDAFLRQRTDEPSDLQEADAALLALMADKPERTMGPAVPAHAESATADVIPAIPEVRF